MSGKSEDVKTKAGTYKAITVMTEIDVASTKIKTKLWFAPDLGMVKQDTLIGEQTVTLELVKFEAAK